MPPIELDDVMAFLLSKFNQKDIKDSLERVLKKFDDISSAKNNEEGYDAETRHKVINRKYG